jgi:hypothetical protein
LAVLVLMMLMMVVMVMVMVMVMMVMVLVLVVPAIFLYIFFFEVRGRSAFLEVETIHLQALHNNGVPKIQIQSDAPEKMSRQKNWHVDQA